MKDQQILSALERLGAAFPWEKVSFHIDRLPEGEVQWWVVLHGRSDLGLHFECKISDQVHNDVNALVDYAIKEWAERRNPEKALGCKIKELRQQIEKLQAAVIGPPPFRPNRELALNTQPASADV